MVSGQDAAIADYLRSELLSTLRRRGPDIPHPVIDPRGRRAVGRRGRDRHARSGGAPALAGPGQSSRRAARRRCALLPVPPRPVRVPAGRARAPGARDDERSFIAAPPPGSRMRAGPRSRSSTRWPVPIERPRRVSSLRSPCRCTTRGTRTCSIAGSGPSTSTTFERLPPLAVVGAPGERPHREGRGRGATRPHRRTLDVRRKPWRRFRVVRVCARDPAGGHGAARTGRHARERPAGGRGRAARPSPWRPMALYGLGAGAHPAWRVRHGRRRPGRGGRWRSPRRHVSRSTGWPCARPSRWHGPTGEPPSDSHGRAMPPSTRHAFATSPPPSTSTPSSARVAIHRGDSARGREELVHAQLVRPLASYALPWTAVGALIELARAYLAIADTAGARTAVAEAEAVVRRRPDLGLLTDRLAELRRQVDAAASSLAGPSTLTPAELRVLPAALHAPHVPGDRGPPVQFPQHDPLPRGVHLREARGHRPRRGCRAGDRARPPGAVPRARGSRRGASPTGTDSRPQGSTDLVDAPRPGWADRSAEASVATRCPDAPRAPRLRIERY